MALLAVIAGTGATRLLNLQGHGVALLGDIQQGLPSLGLPHVSRHDLNELLPLTMACFVFAAVETSAIGRMFGQKHGYRFDANQELLALGAADLVSGLARGSPVSGGMSQTLVNPHAGVGVDRRRIHVESWRASHRGCCGTGRSRCRRRSCSRRL